MMMFLSYDLIYADFFIIIHHIIAKRLAYSKIYLNFVMM